MISIVIVTFNREKDLRDALHSIALQDVPDREIIVVDNSSTDGTLVMLDRDFPNVKVIALKENIGMDGYSVGFREAKGEIIFQMDNDSLMPDRHVLTEVVKRFTEGPEDLAVIATRVEEYREGIDDIKLLRASETRRGPINTGGFHSGGVGFRKSLLDKVGYYNRDIFLYGAELFLQMKFLAAGYKIFFYPELLMLHKSSGVARSPRGLYYELRNRYWFMRCFATSAQRVRFLPSMIIHDAVYAAFKGGLRVFAQSVKDGFGCMPASVRPIVSCLPQFTIKVDEVGRHFGFARLFSKAERNMKAMGNQ